jgi:hypothetical protein
VYSATKNIAHPTATLHLGNREIELPGIPVCRISGQLPLFTLYRGTDEVPSTEQSEGSQKREHIRLTACANLTAILESAHQPIQSKGVNTHPMSVQWIVYAAWSGPVHA